MQRQLQSPGNKSGHDSIVSAPLTPRPHSVQLKESLRGLDFASGESKLAPEVQLKPKESGSSVPRKEGDDIENTVVADKDIEYPDAFKGAMAKFLTLSTNKTLYKKEGGKKIGKLLKHQNVTVVSTGDTKGERTWKKVKGNTEDGGFEGWINAKESATEDNPFEHGELDAAPMDKAGPSAADIRQFCFSDCVLLASLLTMIQNAPDSITNGLFATSPKVAASSYTLRFFRADKNGALKAEHVTVSASILKTTGKLRDKSGGMNEKGTSVGSKGANPWPALVEKALKAWSGHSRDVGIAGAEGNATLMALTGEKHAREDLSIYGGDLENAQQCEASSKQRMLKAYEAKPMMVVDTGSEVPAKWVSDNPQKAKNGGSSEKMVGGIAFPHAYSVARMDNKGMSLVNPWGRYSRVNGKVNEKAAVSVLTWEEFFAAFRGGKASLAGGVETL